MSAAHIPIGLLFSSDGPYSAVSRSMINGALLAISEVNAEGDVILEPTHANPAGELARYASFAGDMLARGIRHVVGCYTSSSRKEVIPLFEKADALLWYPSHYEGFESSANVIYTGAVANQHLAPLVDFLLERCGRTAFCVGSNYIWAWENNRILREQMGRSGAAVVAERYFPMGAADFDQVIGAILDARPSFIFNTLIGVSACSFLRSLRAACIARGIDQALDLPVASCTLSEPELEAIGPAAVDGHISSSVYFSSVTSAENASFVAAYGARFPEGPAVCADAEAAYIAVRLLALAVRAAGSTDVEAVKDAVGRQVIQAPQGEVWIDPSTLHAALTPRIARSTRDARFEILLQSPSPVRPDPYLTWNSSRLAMFGRRPALRVVSS
ncbi:MAG: transporter substrate-binding domain-containing protein [Methylocella sp.]